MRKLSSSTIPFLYKKQFPPAVLVRDTFLDEFQIHRYARLRFGWTRKIFEILISRHFSNLWRRPSVRLNETNQIPIFYDTYKLIKQTFIFPLSPFFRLIYQLWVFYPSGLRWRGYFFSGKQGRANKSEVFFIYQCLFFAIENWLGQWKNPRTPYLHYFLFFALCSDIFLSISFIFFYPSKETGPKICFKYIWLYWPSSGPKKGGLKHTRIVSKMFSSFPPKSMLS